VSPNGVGFMLYVILGHRTATTPTCPRCRTSASDGDETGSPMSGINQLGLSMPIAAEAAT